MPYFIKKNKHKYSLFNDVSIWDDQYLIPFKVITMLVILINSAVKPLSLSCPALNLEKMRILRLEHLK